MRVFVQSFGCRVNQYEGEKIRQDMVSGGATDAVGYEDADVCVINTCTVTGNADSDARLLARRVQRRNPAAKLIITGCYASVAREELRRLFPEALIVGNDGKGSIAALSGCSMGLTEDSALTAFLGHTRAFIKVQDGCNMHCTYCIIPSARSVMGSRPLAQVIAEVEGLYAKGHREFVFCGIRLGRYWSQGADGRFSDLGALVRAVSAIDGDFRIRLSSIEITDLTDRFLEGYVADAKTVPYFHVPVQSGSDRVLSSMKRWYTSRFFADRVERVRAVVGADTAVFTDYMVGFPTETEEDFRDSLDFAKQVGFAGMHIFRYSPREGTPAAAMTPVYTPEQLNERIAMARAVDERLRRDYASRFMGARIMALKETQTQQGAIARAENFLEVELPVGDIADGWREVTVSATKGPRLVAAGDPPLAGRASPEARISASGATSAVSTANGLRRGTA
ncbi:MAG: tRNA (N(6)-L-threonylcarbamoyladenosine(37)-C(2))-methylthiotransferase MtaB [Elusimicrobiota bacterium]